MVPAGNDCRSGCLWLGAGRPRCREKHVSPVECALGLQPDWIILILRTLIFIVTVKGIDMQVVFLVDLIHSIVT